VAVVAMGFEARIDRVEPTTFNVFKLGAFTLFDIEADVPVIVVIAAEFPVIVFRLASFTTVNEDVVIVEADMF
jgi:hypothetical protein